MELLVLLVMIGFIYCHFFEVFGGGGASKLGLLLICFALEVTYNALMLSNRIAYNAEDNE